MVYSNVFLFVLAFCSYCLGKSGGHLQGKNWQSAFRFLTTLCRLYCLYSFPVWLLEQKVEFDLSVKAF